MSTGRWSQSHSVHGHYLFLNQNEIFFNVWCGVAQCLDFKILEPKTLTETSKLYILKFESFNI